MHRLIALIAALLAGTALVTGASVQPAGASRASGGRGPSNLLATGMTSRGVRLVLQLPGIAYPSNALVRATVRLTNLTGNRMSIWDCPAASLVAEVVGPGDVSLYPPLLPPPGAPWSQCLGATAGPRLVNVVPIAPDQTFSRMTYIVLRSFSVRARADVRLDPMSGKPTTIETPILHLRMRAAAGPLVRLIASRDIRAEVTPVPGGGPVLYSQFASCGDAAHARHPIRASAAFSRWTRAPGNILRPFNSPCSVPNEWSLFVGQPGRPVAHIYDCARSDRCDYAPPTPQEQGISACKRAVGNAIRTGTLPQNTAVARYAVGLTPALPPGLTPEQQKVAQALHHRCFPLLHSH